MHGKRWKKVFSWRIWRMDRSSTRLSDSNSTEQRGCTEMKLNNRKIRWKMCMVEKKGRMCLPSFEKTRLSSWWWSCILRWCHHWRPLIITLYPNPTIKTLRNWNSRCRNLMGVLAYLEQGMGRHTSGHSWWWKEVIVKRMMEWVAVTGREWGCWWGRW